MGEVPSQTKKIMRIFFNAVGEDFCIDRPLIDGKTDQENTDIAMGILVESMQKNSIVPALKIIKDDGADKKGKPIFMNLGQLPYIHITNVGTYELPA